MLFCIWNHIFALTSMGLGCPNVSLNETHLKERDFQHLGSFFLDCIRKHNLGISINIGMDVYNEIHPLGAPSFAPRMLLTMKGLLRGLSEDGFWLSLAGTVLKCKLIKLPFDNLFCMFFLRYKAVMIQWGPSRKQLYKKRKIPITFNPDSHQERILVTCWRIGKVGIVGIEKYRIAQKPTRQMSDFPLGCGDPERACTIELTIHLRMC